MASFPLYSCTGFFIGNCLVSPDFVERVETLPGDRRVGLPVPDAATRQDMGRPLVNRDPSRNMGLLVPAGVPPALPGAVGSHQAGDKMARLRIDPLIDRLVADGMLRMPAGKPSGGELGRPASAEAVFHVPTDRVVFKAAVAPGQAIAILRALLRLVGEIVAGVHRRGIASKLP